MRTLRRAPTTRGGQFSSIQSSPWSSLSRSSLHNFAFGDFLKIPTVYGPSRTRIVSRSWRKIKYNYIYILQFCGIKSKYTTKFPIITDAYLFFSHYNYHLYEYNKVVTFWSNLQFLIWEELIILTHHDLFRDFVIWTNISQRMSKQLAFWCGTGLFLLLVSEKCAPHRPTLGSSFVWLVLCKNIRTIMQSHNNIESSTHKTVLY